MVDGLELHISMTHHHLVSINVPLEMSFSGSSDTNLKKSKLYASRTRGAVLDVRPSLSPMHLSLCTERVGRIANMVQRKISLVVCLQRCKQALEYFNSSQLARLTLKCGIRIEKLSSLVSSS